jgi:hypothetical protein
MYGGLDTWRHLSDATRLPSNLVEVVDEVHRFLSAVLHYPVRAPVFLKEAEVAQKPALLCNRPQFEAWSRFAPTVVGYEGEWTR